jgi:Glucose / Sorbosone dehydrogenase
VKTKFSARTNVVFTAICLLTLTNKSATAAEGTPGIGLKLLAEGFTSPTALMTLDDGTERLLVADQIGVVYVLTKDGVKEEQPFFDVRSRLAQLKEAFDERGLLGLALHPRFKESRKVYMAYSAPLRPSAPQDWFNAPDFKASDTSTFRVSEFRVLPNDSGHLDPASERVLLEIDKPYFNHNGGCIAFGPDGYLYISVGDGGNANDEGRGHSPQGNGQDTTVLLGKILRIDVDKGNPYVVPADNPFADGKKGRPEIFAYGMRNAWRISFDRGGSHELFAGDVGQTMYEEVDIIVKGGNYGWNIREGFHCFNAKDALHPRADCPKVGASGEPLLDPVLEYKNINGHRKDPEARGISITGGYVYRGKALPQLEGRYVFGDWSRNFVLPDGVLLVASRPGSPAEKAWTLKPLELSSPQKIGAFIVAFGQDAEGELYVLTNGRNMITGNTGKVYKLAPM